MAEDQQLPEQAEETAPPAQGTSRFYSEEELRAEIERVRQQEKDKLYPQISKTSEQFKTMQEELKELRAAQKKAEKAEADRQAAIEAERKRREEAEMSAKEFAEKVRQETAAELERLRAERAQEVAMMQKEIEFQKLAAHVQRRIVEEGDAIAPEFHDYIGGNTIEEIEASIERAKAKTEQIWQGIQEAQRARRAGMPGVAPAAGTNGVGPMDTPADRQYSDKDIQAMGMKEYAEFRQRVGIGNASNQGLFR